MRRTVSLALLVPAFLLASALHPVTILPQEDGSVQAAGPGYRAENPPSVAGEAALGVVDTVGGTTMDWVFNGPTYRVLVNSPEHGMHVAWMYSATDGAMPDRNMRYNFYDYSIGEWNWVDPDFMQSGVNVYTERTGFGNLDADPADGVAIVSAHMGSPLYPEIARDLAPGAGLFEYCSGSPNAVGYQWPYLSVGGNSAVHLAMIDGATTDQLFYAKVDPWCEMSIPVGAAAPQPDPMFTSQNVAASKISNRVALTWEYQEGNPDPGFYRISEDGGATWQNPEELPWPNAYGGDTLTSFHITSLFPFFDMNDELHIMASIMPFVGGQGFIIPAQIWHWSQANTPNWTHIHTADPAILLAPVGYNAIFATRPSIGSDVDGNLFVAWEQFDGENIEPGPPELCRADIFYSYSSDNGQSWADAEKITTPSTVSHRFPSMMDHITDEVAVTYLIDQQAGFLIQGEGPMTNNPVVVQRWPNPLAGVKEKPATAPRALTVSAGPNPFARNTQISYVLPRTGEASLVVYDAAGRPVRSLAAGRMEPGRYSAAWDGRDNAGSRVAAGVYLYRLVLDSETVSGKLLLTN